MSTTMLGSTSELDLEEGVGDELQAVDSQAKPKRKKLKKKQARPKSEAKEEEEEGEGAVAPAVSVLAPAPQVVPPPPERVNTAELGRSTTYNEHGHREVDENIEDAPTFAYVCGVSLCPGCGAAVADYYSAKENDPEDVEVPTIDLEDMQQAKADLKEYISGVDKKPTNSTPCAAPIQLEMDYQPLSMIKQPDIVCNICSICCCWRGAAVTYFIAYALPTLAAAKYGLGWIAVCTVMVCLCVSLFARILACCFPLYFRTNTPELRQIFLNVVDMKRVDVLDGENAKKNDPMFGKPKFALTQAWKYFKAMLRGFCCCQFFRPSAIFTFAKILVAMIFTEVAMTFSAYLFFVARFTCGSGCWTLGSFAGWVRELKKSKALKKRVINFMYPAWGFDPAGEDEDSSWPKDPKPTMCDPCKECCMECLCACPCCMIYKNCGCDICCTIGCAICRPMCVEMCDMGIDVGMEITSALFLVGKALYYTDRMLKGKKQAPRDTE